MLDFAIDLRQALFAAHGQDGMTKSHKNAKQANNGTSLVPSRKPSASLLNFKLRVSAPEADARRV